MTPLRVTAAAAAILTALLLQGALIGPVFAPLAVSLPAVMIAAVALHDGASTGLCLGFAAGLIADLGSAHPAGLFALAWMGVGLCCGRAADPRRGTLSRALLSGAACGAATAVTSLVMMLVQLPRTGVGGSWVVQVGGAAALDAALALAVVPLVAAFLDSAALNARRARRSRRTAVRHG
jgi:rod shape-determining protein MreD